MQPSAGARRVVIEELNEALTTTLTGRGTRTLVLTAGPGMGKTHTLRAMTAGLGISTRWATAEDLSWRQPYAVMSDLLGEPIVGAASSSTIADDLFAALDDLCAREPQLLVVDDAHSADSGTLQVLGRASAAARDLPLTIVVARRHLPRRELLDRLLSRPHVREWNLPLMDESDLLSLALARLGARPDDRIIRRVLARSAGHPLHALALLDSLDSGGSDRERFEAGLESGTLQDAIRQQIALLDGGARDLIDKLAVWGGPATIAELAGIGGTEPATLLGAVRTTIDAGLVEVNGAGRMLFSHDAYADATYQQMPVPIRVALHEATARLHAAAGNRQMAAHHMLATGERDSEVMAAVVSAHRELAHAPSVAADLLASAPHSGDTAPPGLEIELATALARSGQLTRAAQVAADALPAVTNPRTAEQLNWLLLFTLINTATAERVHVLTAAMSEQSIDLATRGQLEYLDRYVDLMEGREWSSTAPPPFSAAHSIISMETEALRLFVAGRFDAALRLALEASGRDADTDDRPTDLNRAVEIWPPLIEMHRRGPVAAEALLDRALRQRTDRDIPWMSCYLEIDRGMIQLARGFVDDAAASLDDAMDVAAGAEMRWTSLAEGSRCLIDIYRGDIVPATTRLAEFANSGRPDVLGFPLAARADALLLESQRKLRPAADAARRCWVGAASSGRHGWLPTFALDHARIAVRLDDADHLATVISHFDLMSEPDHEFDRSMTHLATLLCTALPDDVLPAAAACASLACDRGDRIIEAACWEEAAVAAAALGDKDAARLHARAALAITQTIGARALTARIVSRLRPYGVRMQSSGIRDRPRAGWGSLTPTEVTIAELVGSGLSGREIAERQFISTRTVQTHVSRVLTKLGLRTRLELATFVAARTGAS